jgi:integrase
MSKSGTRAPNKMGSIRKRPDGRWEGRYTGADGRQHSVYGKTQKAAAEALRAATHSVDAGSWLQPSCMTMNQWLDVWLRDYQAHTTGRTVSTYTAVVRKHMRPLFGAVRVSALSQIHVRRMIGDMSRSGLAPATIRHALAILSASMRCAVEAGLRSDNPADGIKAPRPVKSEFTVIDRDMFPAFIAAAGQTDVGLALVFLLLTGLRAGELRALRWSDVDLDAATMRVERQLRQVNASDRRIGPPKDGSARTVYLTPPAVALLRQQRKDQATARLAAAEWIEDDITRDLIFRDARGWNLTDRALYSAVKSVQTALGLPNLRVHDLRHSYAVAALRAGTDVKTVQHNLGHKHASITLDIYAAYTDDAGRTAAARLADYWADATK